MKHTPIQLPLGGNPNGDDPPENLTVAEGEIRVESPEWLRIFGAPSPIAERSDPVSTRTLSDIEAVRAHQVSKGHTPESDAAHTDGHFTDAVGEFLTRARTARRPETRRKNLVIAASVLVAMIDADDYRAAHSGGTGNHD